jgi:hypothetical protein
VRHSDIDHGGVSSVGVTLPILGKTGWREKGGSMSGAALRGNFNILEGRIRFRRNVSDDMQVIHPIQISQV